MKHILVLGLNPAWQKTLFFDRLMPYEVNRAKKAEARASGKGVNFTRAAAKWGVAAATVVQPAGGVTGKLLAESLAKEELSCVTVNTESETRVCSTLLCAATHSATEIIEPSGTVLPEEYERFLAVAKLELGNADALAVCGTYPPGVPESCYADLTRAAADMGKPVLLDAYRGIRPALEAGVRILKINRAELHALTGITVPQRGIAECLKQWPKLEIVAITAGKDPALLGTRAGLWEIAVPRIRGAVNPIGAGDTCSGVFFSEYLNGTAPEEAFVKGLCAASASCLTDSAAEFDPEYAKKLAESVRAVPVKG